MCATAPHAAAHTASTPVDTATPARDDHAAARTASSAEPADVRASGCGHAAGNGERMCRQVGEGGVRWSAVEESGAQRGGRWDAVFLGTHTPRLDDKGRLFLPAKFRDELAEGLVVTRGQERCLYVFPAAEFAAFTERTAQGPGHQQARPATSCGCSSPAPRDETAGQAGPGHAPAGAARPTPGSTATASSSAPTPGSRSGTPTAWETLHRRAGARVRRLVRGGAARRLTPDALTRRLVAPRSPDRPSALLAHLPRCQTGRRSGWGPGRTNGRAPQHRRSHRSAPAHRARTSTHRPAAATATEPKGRARGELADWRWLRTDEPPGAPGPRRGPRRCRGRRVCGADRHRRSSVVVVTAR